MKQKVFSIKKRCLYIYTTIAILEIFTKDKNPIVYLNRSMFVFKPVCAPVQYYIVKQRGLNIKKPTIVFFLDPTKARIER